MGKIDFDAIRAAVEAKGNAVDKRCRSLEERTYFKWSAELTDKLIDLVDRQKTAEEISAELGVPLDKVRSKLTALKARMVSVTEKPRPAAKAAAEPQKAKPQSSDRVDWVVFHALDELVLRLQADGEDPSRTFRRAIELLDLWAEGLCEQIEQLPAARAHFSAIGAIMAYQTITGKELQEQ